MPLRIGIIGFGPKGLYGLEELLAQIKHAAIKVPIDIHLFNKTVFFGPGDIYRPDQPRYLLMNFANHNIKFHREGKPNFLDSAMDDYVHWLNKKTGQGNDDIINSFSPRGWVGEYLTHCFDKVCQNLPNHITITPHVATISRIHRKDKGYSLESEEDGNWLPNHYFKKLLITTGHVWHRPQLSVNQKAMAGYIDFVYPVTEQLAQIGVHTKVAIKGMGLTYIDTALSLTEGRGGTFKLLPNGSLQYIPSGKEPAKLYPFSRTGLPMIPRTGTQGEMPVPSPIIQDILGKMNTAKPTSFVNTILPRIKQLFHYAYYRTLFQVVGWELKYHPDYSKVEEQVANFHLEYSQLPKFSWLAMEDPFHSIRQPSHSYTSFYLKHLIKEAELGIGKSPLLTATAVWRQISPIFNGLYCFGGLDAPSHQVFDNYYFGLFNRLAYGPPLENAKKMVALQEAGIIDLSYSKNPLYSYDSNTQKHVLKQGEMQEWAHYLVNATIPKANNSNGYQGLLHTMLENGMLRYYRNNNNGNYIPGCIDLDNRGRPYDIDGNINEDLTFYGTPTEGLTFDNDTLSRERNNFASHWAKSVLKTICEKQHLHKNIKTDEIR